jgi:YD repeat-containing protein
MRYDWSRKDRLLGMVNELTRHGTWFEYDASGNLTGSEYDGTEKLFRVPDAVGNLYRRPDCKDRTYGAGGRLLETENAKYHYDTAGNLGAKVVDNSKVWLYKWNANGSLREVERPDRRTVCFEYDALGRRTAKIFDGKVTRWVWDGNTPLHEWTYEEKDRPKTIIDEYGLKHTEGTEPTENITTWVFEEGSFRPAAKLPKNKNFTHQISVQKERAVHPVLFCNPSVFHHIPDAPDCFSSRLISFLPIMSIVIFYDCPNVLFGYV